MGAYLSQPITKKESSDHEGSNVSCGASSMQGWRIYQEDAHNVIIDFDEKKSLFAVYDGHGGSEVAIYTSKHLPRFIKNTEEYKKGNYKQALINAFMEFDENLIKDEVMAVLKDLKKENEGDDSYPATDEDALDDDDGDNVNNLYEEATMPLSEVISRYRNPGIQRLKESGEKPMSPRLKSKDKKSNEEGAEGCSSSSSAGSSGVTGSLSVPAAGSSSSCASSSSSSSPKSSKMSNAPSSSSSANSSSTKEEGASSPSKPESSSASSSSTPTASTDEASSTLSSSVKDEKESNGPAASSVSSSKPEANGSEEKKKNRETNGGAKPAAAATEEEAVISSSDVKPLKAKDKPIIVVTNGDSEPDSSAHAPLSNGNKVQRTSPRKTLGTKNLLDSTMADDSSESDEDFQIDEDLQGSSSDSDEGDEHIFAAARNLPEIDSDEDDEDGEEEEEEEDSDEDDSDYEEGEGGALSPEDLQKRMKEALDHKDVPGMDSGCTAVVVLFVDNQIYIANAGDSRAVLCRGPMAVDLSEDHKPEDDVERARIVKAGGEVTPDGRVNGGLNLSRALGDHSYKQTAALPLSEQMITALPDVTVQTLQPDDKFIVIACDGIWNSLSSQEVVDFIIERIDKPDKKLSTICEELFDKCLAPDSLGDGTGCDNMTCVLVRLNGNRGPVESHAHSSSTAQTAATKRTRDEAEEEEEEASEAKPSAKKTKTDANEAAEAVAKITEEKSKTVDEPMSVESTTTTTTAAAAAEATGSAKSTSESTEDVVGSST